MSADPVVLGHMALDMFSRLNSLRAYAGRTPFGFSLSLGMSAQQHANAMAENDTLTPQAEFEAACQVSAGIAPEGSAQQALTVWETSGRDGWGGNNLWTSLLCCGIGVQQSASGRWYWSLRFGSYTTDEEPQHVMTGIGEVGVGPVIRMLAKTGVDNAQTIYSDLHVPDVGTQAEVNAALDAVFAIVDKKPATIAECQAQIGAFMALGRKLGGK